MKQLSLVKGRSASTYQYFQFNTTTCWNRVGYHTFFIQLYSKKRKYHYDSNIRPVFTDWGTTDFYHETNFVYGLTNSDIPIYLDVVNSINNCDQFHEALPDLRSYKKEYSIYENLKKRASLSSKERLSFYHPLKDSSLNQI